MDIEISFPGEARVEARIKGFVIETDQAVHEGGGGSAPNPFDLFLASIGSCAGVYALNFCRQRNISPSDLRIQQHVQVDPTTHMVVQVDLMIHLPPDFPAQYAPALVRAVELCTVKRHLDHPPALSVRTSAG